MTNGCGLDATRLAEAMDIADPPLSDGWDDEDRAEHRAYAEALAPIYARLATPTEEPTGSLSWRRAICPNCRESASGVCTMHNRGADR